MNGGPDGAQPIQVNHLKGVKIQPNFGYRLENCRNKAFSHVFDRANIEYLIDLNVG